MYLMIANAQKAKNDLQDLHLQGETQEDVRRRWGEKAKGRKKAEYNECGQEKEESQGQVGLERMQD